MSKTYKIIATLIIITTIAICGYFIFNICKANDIKQNSTLIQTPTSYMIEGISLKSTYYEVQEKIGEPEYTDYTEGENGKSYLNCYYDNGKTVASFCRADENAEYKLTILTTSNSEYKTSDEIKIGTSKDEIIEKFSDKNINIIQEEDFKDIEITEKTTETTEQETFKITQEQSTEQNNATSNTETYKLIFSIDLQTDEVRTMTITIS